MGKGKCQAIGSLRECGIIRFPFDILYGCTGQNGMLEIYMRNFVK